MDFVIKRSGKFCVVVDSAGIRHGGPLSFKDAQVKKDELDAAERDRLVNDPDVLSRRRAKAAYRQLKRHPVLQRVRKLAKQGSRNTLKSYDRMTGGNAPFKLMGAVNERRAKDGLAPYTVFSFEKCMSIASSDSEVHAELNKSDGHRNTSKATKARGQVGASTLKQVVALKKSGMRQVDIAKKLNISPEWVSKILGRAKRPT